MGRGRPSTDTHWRERVRALTANSGMGGRAIAAQLAREQVLLGRNDAPGERTVFRIQEAFRQLPEWEQRLYESFRWPESMEMGAVPYEASAAALELLGHLRSASRVQWERPSNRLVLWFWRVTQAAADLPAATRAAMARSLAAWEILGKPSHPGELEWRLAFAPWRSTDAERRYRDAVESSGRDDVDPVRQTALGPVDEWLTGGFSFNRDQPESAQLAALQMLGMEPLMAKSLLSVLDQLTKQGDDDGPQG